MGARLRRWRQRMVGGLVLFVSSAVLAVFLAAAWASNYPDAAAVHRAMSWPWVGPWITRAHRLYRPPVALPVAVENRDQVAREPASIVVSPPHVDTRATLMVAPGTLVRGAPAGDARVLAELEIYTNLKVLERRGDWHKIWRQARGRRPLEGWIHQSDTPPGEPPLGREPVPPGPLEPQPPDAARLAAARGLLVGERTRALGPYSFYTDSANRILEDWLAALAPAVERSYVQRFGRQPLGTPRAAVVLFATEDTYQRFKQRWAELRGSHSAGHAEGGIVALWDGGQDLASVASTFVHELVHLLNRRALGPALPPWIGEGLAEALDTAVLRPDGTIEPKAVGGRVWKVGEAITWIGGQASLRQLQRAIVRDTLPPLEILTSFDRAAFMRATRQSLLYAQSGFLFRYLLDAEQGRHAPALHAFLDAVASGQPATGEALRQRLGISWQALDTGFRAWIVSLT